MRRPPTPLGQQACRRTCRHYRGDFPSPTVVCSTWTWREPDRRVSAGDPVPRTRRRDRAGMGSTWRQAVPLLVANRRWWHDRKQVARKARCWSTPARGTVTYVDGSRSRSAATSTSWVRRLNGGLARTSVVSRSRRSFTLTVTRRHGERPWAERSGGFMAWDGYNFETRHHQRGAGPERHHTSIHIEATYGDSRDEAPGRNSRTSPTSRKPRNLDENGIVR